MAGAARFGRRRWVNDHCTAQQTVVCGAQRPHAVANHQNRERADLLSTALQTLEKGVDGAGWDELGAQPLQQHSLALCVDLP